MYLENNLLIDKLNDMTSRNYSTKNLVDIFLSILITKLKFFYDSYIFLISYYPFGYLLIELIQYEDIFCFVVRGTVN